MAVEIETQKKWYVYFLCDPDTEVPFYIGKGQGIRAEFHLKYNRYSSNRAKDKMIDGIQAQGKQVLIKKVAFFEKEEDAYIYEWAMIGLYHEHITNIKHGRGRRYENYISPKKPVALKGNNPSQDLILTDFEVADMFGTDVKEVRRLVIEEDLEGFRTAGAYGKWRFYRSDIDKFIQQQREKAQQRKLEKRAKRGKKQQEGSKEV